MKLKRLSKIETNRSVANKVRKHELEQKGKIKCGLCPYNRGENANKRPLKNWKQSRKTKYRVMGR